MDTITAALILACLALLAWPGVVRRRGPLFLAVGLLAVVLLFDLVPGLFGAVVFRPGSGRFIGFVMWVLSVVLTVLRLAAFLLLVMAVSGLGMGELLREVSGGLQSLTRSEAHGFPVTPPTGTAPTPSTGPQSTGPGGSPPPKI